MLGGDLGTVHPRSPFFDFSTHYDVVMKFLVNVDFKRTLEIFIDMVDPDPEKVTSVLCAKANGVSVYFEAPHGAELWTIVDLAASAFKEFVETEEI